jgi:DNA phosphorothioation-dependent restriction protein DptG
MDVMNPHFKFLSWNVCGLNGQAKREDVKQVISTHRTGLVCLQETKLQSVNATIARHTLGPNYELNYFLPAIGTRGGILVAEKISYYQLQ